MRVFWAMLGPAAMLQIGIVGLGLAACCTLAAALASCLISCKTLLLGGLVFTLLCKLNAAIGVCLSFGRGLGRQSAGWQFVMWVLMHGRSSSTHGAFASRAVRA